jgi:hypothetical protein
MANKMIANSSLAENSTMHANSSMEEETSPMTTESNIESSLASTLSLYWIPLAYTSLFVCAFLKKFT